MIKTEAHSHSKKRKKRNHIGFKSRVEGGRRTKSVPSSRTRTARARRRGAAEEERGLERRRVARDGRTEAWAGMDGRDRAVKKRTLLKQSSGMLSN